MEPTANTPPLETDSAPVLSPLEAERAALISAVQNGAGWFFFVVGLSLVNSLIALTGFEWNFAIGLGVTTILDVFAAEAKTTGKVVLFVVGAVALGFYALMGMLARRYRWAFVVGGLFYLVDAIIFVVAKDWIGIAVHAYVLFVFGKAFVSAGRLKQLPPPQVEAVGAVEVGETPAQAQSDSTSASSFEV